MADLLLSVMANSVNKWRWQPAAAGSSRAAAPAARVSQVTAGTDRILALTVILTRHEGSLQQPGLCCGFYYYCRTEETGSGQSGRAQASSLSPSLRLTPMRRTDWDVTGQLAAAGSHHLTRNKYFSDQSRTQKTAANSTRKISCKY